MPPTGMRRIRRTGAPTMSSSSTVSSGNKITPSPSSGNTKNNKSSTIRGMMAPGDDGSTSTCPSRRIGSVGSAMEVAGSRVGATSTGPSGAMGAAGGTGTTTTSVGASLMEKLRHQDESEQQAQMAFESSSAVHSTTDTVMTSGTISKSKSRMNFPHGAGPSRIQPNVGGYEEDDGSTQSSRKRLALLRSMASNMPSPFQHSKRTMAMVYNAFGDCKSKKGDVSIHRGNKMEEHEIETKKLLCSSSLKDHDSIQQSAMRKIVRLGGSFFLFLSCLVIIRNRIHHHGNGSSSISNLSFSSDPSKQSLSKSSSTALRSSVPVAQVVFPPHLAHLSNLTMTYHPQRETPYFWDVHFSGESIAEVVFGQCHHLIQACEFGLRQPDFNEDKLELFNLDGVQYVNVDTTTIDGIVRASKLELAKTRLANVIISPHFHEMAARIFTPTNPGRMFSLFRHPVDRALGMYYYLAKASWDPMYNPELSKMSIEQYAKSPYIENNWLTRFLVHKPKGKLVHSDMVMAKQILKYKCLVGLYDDIETSLARFQRYFGWNLQDTPERKADIPKCRKAFVDQGDKNVLGHPVSIKGKNDVRSSKGELKSSVKVGSAAWNAIVRQNKYDMELYDYATKIYKIQGEQIFDVVG